jgi:hypothetical protein
VRRRQAQDGLVASIATSVALELPPMRDSSFRLISDSTWITPDCIKDEKTPSDGEDTVSNLLHVGTDLLRGGRHTLAKMTGKSFPTADLRFEVSRRRRDGFPLRQHRSAC